MSVVRNVLAIVLVSVAGFCVVAAQMAAFMKVGQAGATAAFGMIGWAMLVLMPAIVDVMQQQGAYSNARMFRFVPEAGVWLMRRG
ncbi:TPA: hypothetical protein SAY52_004167 [Burkholderia cenocepacia]|uniref:hypothetical protein n=1 Tax=unclassified Burkholderia TaxID=2613784 RepID=UPI00158C7DD1|nr:MULTISPECIES: hypothetical protein [unclassified Burkholderia]HEF5873512.1 hypothetical protein [Burkholderia cenocepacia]